MKNKFKQHIPGWANGCIPEQFDFNTTEQLLDHFCIKHWKTHPGFYRFSIDNASRDPKDKQYCILMVELNEGKEWWVLGYIKYPHSINLPKWEPKE